MIVDPIVKYRTLAMAKATTPIDTGNLRHNATRLKKVRSDSWTINYSSDEANYIEFVEEGTVKQPAQRFIYNTSLMLAMYLTRYFAGKPVSHWQQGLTREALSTAQNNREREMRNFESRNKSSNVNWR